jgi:hypothetical protein
MGILACPAGRPFDCCSYRLDRRDYDLSAGEEYMRCVRVLFAAAS